MMTGPRTICSPDSPSATSLPSSLTRRTSAATEATQPTQRPSWSGICSQPSTQPPVNKEAVNSLNPCTEKKRDDGAACFHPSIIDLGIVEAQVPSLVAQRRSDAPKLGPAAFAARRRLSLTFWRRSRFISSTWVKAVSLG